MDLTIRIKDELTKRGVGVIFRDTKYYAYDDDREVGHLTVCRFLQIEDSQFFTEFWRDGNKPRPFTFYEHIEREYRGNGVAGELIKFANKHCKETYGTPLYSGVCNSESAVCVWEKLVDRGEAFETSYEGKRRWGLY